MHVMPPARCFNLVADQWSDAASLKTGSASGESHDPRSLSRALRVRTRLHGVLGPTGSSVDLVLLVDRLTKSLGREARAKPITRWSAIALASRPFIPANASASGFAAAHELCDRSIRS